MAADGAEVVLVPLDENSSSTGVGEVRGPVGTAAVSGEGGSRDGQGSGEADDEDFVISAAPRLGPALNLANSIIGAGILGMGQVFAWLGIVPALFVLSAVCAVMHHTAKLIVRIVEKEHFKTYNELATAVLGRRVSDLFMWLTVVGVAGALISYVILIGDFGQTILDAAGGGSRDVLTPIVLVLVVLPLAMQRSLSRLEHVSMASLALVFFLIVALVVELSMRGLGPDVRLARLHVVDFGRSIPTATFAFFVHLGVIPIYQQLHAPNLHTFRTIARWAFWWCLAMYMGAGILAYAVMGGVLVSYGNLILAFPSSDKLMVVVSAFFACSVAFTYPMVFFFARSIVQVLLFGKADGGPWHHYGVTLALFLVSCAGLFLRDVSFVFGLIGSLSFSAVAIVLPPLLFLRSTIPKTVPEVHYARLLIAGGIVVGAIGAYSTISGSV